MKNHLIRGAGFGTTSGVITTLGLMSGLNATTGSKLVVLGGIVSIAIADSLSDAMGIHISEEATSEKHKHVWEATLLTFLFKFLVASTFAVPLLLFNLSTAFFVSIVWGFALLSVMSFFIAKRNDEKAVFVIAEHLVIAILVIALTGFVGGFVESFV